MRRSRLMLVLVGLLLGSLTVACASSATQPIPPTSAAQTGPPLAPRPFDLHIDDIDPCAALTQEQVSALKLHRQASDPPTSDGGPTCFWAHSSDEPIEGYAIRLNTNSGIERTFGNPRGVVGTTVAGFPAVETQNIHAPRNSTCIIGIDVADEQGLQVNYDYTGSTVPMTRELACQKAKVVAEMAMQTLLARTGG